MSYDVCLVIDTGGEKPVVVTETRCPTFNLAPMFRKALGMGMNDLRGKTGAEVAPLLGEAISRMQATPLTFKALNPPNGWGDYDGALLFLREFLADCHAHPKATVET